MGKLTVREMQALTSSEVGKRLTDEHALFGVVRARGDAISVFFRWRYRFDGKVKDYTCGTWPKDSLANVRKARADAYGCLISGLDPNQRVRTHKLAAKAAQAEEMAKVIGRIEEAESLQARITIRGLFDRWEKLELSARKDAGKEARRGFEKDVFARLGNVAAKDVTQSMIAQILDTVVERGARIVARNLLGELRQIAQTQAS